jgi:hypothetical protein
MNWRTLLVGAAGCGWVAMAAAAPARPAAPARVPAPRPPKTSSPPVAAPAAPGAAVSAEFFEKEIRPLLSENCYACHGTTVHQGGLSLDTRAALLKGGDKGPALVPGDAAKSLLLKAVRHQGLQMPPGRKLADRQIASLERWVREGAAWPEASGAGGATAAAPVAWESIFQARRQWWSLLPLAKPAVPLVRNKPWSAQPVDRFVLAKLEQKGLKPAPPADARTLARRVYLVLTGLPPTPEEVEAFAADRSPDAYSRLVDRVLASPAYGERFARHWMDVVRFSETHGYEWNYEVRDAWRYRDYLIRAFNQDVPYDRMIREHIAGDLLPDPRWNTADGINESLSATAFFRFGENGHDVFKEIGLDVLDNQIDTLSKAFQATTVSCARCHDHKLDAISARDYYGLLGILVSTRQVVQTLDADSVNANPKQRMQGLKADIRRELAGAWSAEAQDLPRYLRAAQAARAKSPDAASLAEGLDAKRLQAWTDALEKTPGGLDDPLNAWRAASAAPDPASAWGQLAAQYAAEAGVRAEFNRKNFKPLGDFRKGKPEGWRVAGLGLRDGPTPSGDFAVPADGDQAISGVFPAGLFTHTLSQRMDGSIQSPWLPAKGFVSLRVMGGRNGVAREIPDHRQLTDSGRDLKPELGWVTFGRNSRDEWVYLELITKLHNPRWDGDEKDPRSFFGITEAVLHEGGEPPKEDLSPLLRLFQGGEARSLDEVAGRYGATARDAVTAWGEGHATDADARWIEWLVSRGLLTNTQSRTPRLAELVAQYRAAEKQLASPRLVAGVADQDNGFDVPVYKRGDYHQPGDPAPRRYLTVLASSTTPATNVGGGSGRRELAERVANPRNPLTARVMVNRIWNWMFGTGLVRSTDDFGHMGDLPSHPELLDYLAGRFMAEGWSVKRMVRTLALSQTFRMASRVDPKAREIEPENRLLHHYPARRLEAEAIRDSILAVSGRLDRSLYGPSIQPYRVDPKPERRLFQGPLDGNGRRSVYTKITLMGGPQFLEVFNFPDPKTAQGRRDVTNVPAQALALLNDPFVIGQADFWAERLTASPDATIEARIDRMFRMALGRPPQAAETARIAAFVRQLAALQQVPEADILKSRPVWKDVAHAVFNLKEFIYVR